MSGAVTKAQAAWGGDLPEWVLMLAQQCDALNSQNKVAKKMGCSGAVISQLLNNKYPGDLAGFEDRFNGVFNKAVIECPAMGEMATHVCQEWRKKSRTFNNVNPQRVTMFRACNRCPRNKGETHD